MSDRMSPFFDGIILIFFCLFNLCYRRQGVNSTRQINPLELARIDCFKHCSDVSLYEGLQPMSSVIQSIVAVKKTQLFANNKIIH